MPTYEYVCEACGNEFENFASMSAPPIKKCPKCKKNKVQRKISTGGGIIFKGGGFYETDYRNDAYQKAAAADKPSEVKADAAKTDVKAPDAKTESKSESKSDSKSESKPEAKQDSKPAATESKSETSAAPAAKSSSAKKSSTGRKKS